VKNAPKNFADTNFCALRNSFLSRLLITPYFDPDFSMAEFKEGAKQAAVLIANSLAEGDLDQVPPWQTLPLGGDSSPFPGCCCSHS